MNVSGSPLVNPKVDVAETNKPINKKENIITEKKVFPQTSQTDNVDLPKIPNSRKNVIKSLNIPLFDVDPKIISQQADKHIKEINNVLSRKNPTLELKDKEEILGILTKSKDNGSLEKLMNKLDKNDKLPSLYKDMGTLVNQGTAGGAISGVLAIFTLGGSMISEARENRAYEMKKLLQDANISPDILNKLEK